MTAFPLQLVLAMLTFVSFIAASGLSSPQLDISAVNQEPTEEWCPPCELFFRKLEKTEGNGKLSQVVRVQERGEPKSGTGFMFDWATGALGQTCNYLQRFFGQQSCFVMFRAGPEMDGHLPARPVTRRMTFEPALGVSDARCPCETIERVSIVLSKVKKHTLPVNMTTCAFSHGIGIALPPDQIEGLPENAACTFADGTPARNKEDLWRCMHEANCDITDDWLQMAVFRDPRPTVVSAYFYLGIHSKRDFGDLEGFITRHLPLMCEWLAVRHILFSGLLPHRSMVFWYNDAIADPLEWHYHFLDSVGLQLPPRVVNAAAEAAAGNHLGFKHKDFDYHPGFDARTGTGVRKFEDEVSLEVLKTANAVLREWLPAVLLEKLGVEPAGEGMKG